MRQIPMALLMLVLSVAAARAQGSTNRPTPLRAGEKIPFFRTIDQSGKERSFADLTGPKGLLLFFHKSADW